MTIKIDIIYPIDHGNFEFLEIQDGGKHLNCNISAIGWLLAGATMAY